MPNSTNKQKAKPKLVLFYNTFDTKGVLPIVTELLLNLKHKYDKTHDILTSKEIYRGVVESITAMLGVNFVIMLDTPGYSKRSCYNKELDMATAKQSQIVILTPVECDEASEFAKEVQFDQDPKTKRLLLQLQYTTNTNNRALKFNRIGLNTLFATPLLENVNANSAAIYVSFVETNKFYVDAFIDAFQELQKKQIEADPDAKKITFELLTGDQRTRENAEKKIFSDKTIAVVLILTPDYVKDKQFCMYEAKFAADSRSKIISTVWEPLDEYPPAELQTSLHDTFINFATIAIHETGKLNFRVEEVRKVALQESNPNSFSRYTDINFIVTSVGAWKEGDVSNWLRYIGLQKYCESFMLQHVNGRVLLSLTRQDFAYFAMSKLHLRVILSSIDALFENMDWNNARVLQWIKEIGLMDIYDKIKDDGSVNGKALLVLTDDVLVKDYKITSAATRSRMLEEVHTLKLKMAKVPIRETYKYDLLKDVIKPVGTNYENFRFHPDAKGVFKDIIAHVKDYEFGLYQTGFQKFLFVVIVLSFIYKQSFKAKFLWFDANKVEMAYIRYGFLKLFLTTEEELYNELKEKAKDFLNFERLYKLTTAITKELTKGNKESPAIDPKTQALLDYFCEKENATISDIIETTDKPNLNYIKDIWLQVVFVENIANEFYPIFDRNMSGYLSLPEILAGLDVILYGSTNDKIKVGFCAADTSCDNYLDPEEVMWFYKKVFTVPFTAIGTSHLLADFPTKKSDTNRTVESFVYEIIEDALDPNFPKHLNKKIIMKSYFNSPEGSFGDSEITNAANLLLIPGGRPFVPMIKGQARGKDKEIYMAFTFRENVKVTNYYLGPGEKADLNVTMWFCSMESKWDELLSENTSLDNDIEKFEFPLKDTPFMYGGVGYIPTRHIYMRLTGPMLSLDFFGIWGYADAERRSPGRPYETRDLFVRAGGILAQTATTLAENRVDISDMTVEYFALAIEYADSERIDKEGLTPTAVTALEVQMKSLTRSMNYAQPKRGNSDTNQARILQDILPFVYLFLLFRGQSLAQILEAAF